MSDVSQFITSLSEGYYIHQALTIVGTFVKALCEKGGFGMAVSACISDGANFVESVRISVVGFCNSLSTSVSVDFTWLFILCVCIFL